MQYRCVRSVAQWYEFQIDIILVPAFSLCDSAYVPLAELGVRLNLDFSPVTRYIRRLRYQAQTGSSAFDFPAEEADEVMKLVSYHFEFYQPSLHF